MPRPQILQPASSQDVSIVSCCDRNEFIDLIAYYCRRHVRDMHITYSGRELNQRPEDPMAELMPAMQM